MTSKLGQEPRPVNSINAIACSACQRPRSRRGGVRVEVDGCGVFICRACCEHLYWDGLDYDVWMLNYFLARGGAA